MAEAKSNELSTVTLKTGFDSSDDEGEINASPFNISWLELNSGEGDDRLGISGLPGCRFKDTWRSLEHDIMAVCTLLILDESLKAEEAIFKVRELRGPGAIQSVKQYNYACEYRSLMKTYREENESEARSISR
ncbi:CDKN3-like protein [Mya arenaria]|uniref:protein-tyrosine-phosphatase n=1 Tax=Mya arenaria TaxID=6604 RepID=A0ABY7FAY1_MYAAR|nr:CDKN3-like protein [Mya arenaria]